MQKRSHNLLLVFLFATSATGLFGQSKNPQTTVKQFLQSQVEAGIYNRNDVQEWEITDHYASSHNQITHIYYQQYHQGLPIANAINGLHVDATGKVRYSTDRFEADLEKKLTTAQPYISPDQGIQRAIQDLDLESYELPKLKEKPSPNIFHFGQTSWSHDDIQVQLLWLPATKNDDIMLAWEVSFITKAYDHYFHIYVDAQKGIVVKQWDAAVKCGNPSHHLPHQTNVEPAAPIFTPTPLVDPSNEAGSYRVYPLPLMDPFEGERSLITTAGTPEASPLGWHEVDGTGEVDYTITRGNNVHAFLDLNNEGISKGDEPDGGDSLLFDFPIDLSQEPETYRDFTVTQTFYVSNWFHDFAYAYGFNEAAGNFQQSNFGNGGRGNDPVEVNVQDGDRFNNANFVVRNDGGNGVMQVYLWESADNKLLEVIEPAEIAGRYFVGTADYGNPVTEEGIEGTIVEAFDESNEPDKGCETIVNADEVSGKIAMVNRGICFFEQKTVEAEKAGAIALIICNFEESPNNMNGVDNIPNPQIPTISLANDDCQRIRLAISEGVNVKLQIPGQEGPALFDGALDNGLLSHELGHGVSFRLTGGPNTVGCLNNDEQMGEGWSDFFSLVTTVKPGDTGTTPISIGRYLFDQDANGKGFRRQQYTTNFKVNSQTYDDVIATNFKVEDLNTGQITVEDIPHPLGEVWTAVLWDLYWKLVEKYGFDEDQLYGNGGNNIAIQLVMDGMKLQSCNPGFIDGRNAILVADQINNGGANECLIWEVFARRGFGWSADQANRDNRDDGIEAFDVYPPCLQELKIAKAMSPIVSPGDTFTVTLNIANHLPETANNVLVTDQIPEGTTFLAVQTEDISTEQIGQSINFDVGQLITGAEKTIKYTLVASPDKSSRTLFFENFQSDGAGWFIDATEGVKIWNVLEDPTFNNGRGWYIPASEEVNDQTLGLFDPILVESPGTAVRILHKYKTEHAWDGGILEISTDGGNSWRYLPEEAFFRNAYSNRLDYGTFVIPNITGFSGDGNEFTQTFADLSDYVGQEVLMRFRFSTDNQGTTSPNGWWIDEFEYLELLNYNSEACISADGASTNCTIAEGRGTIVTGQFSTTAIEKASIVEQFQVYPNPSNTDLNINLAIVPSFGQGQINVINTDGKMMYQSPIELSVAQQNLDVQAASWSPGVYTVSFITPTGTTTKKWIKIN